VSGAEESQHAVAPAVYRPKRVRRLVATRLDPFLVRTFGVSLLSWMVSRDQGTPYVPTLMLRTFDSEGRPARDTPVFYAWLGERPVVVGSFGGSVREPRWARNLRKNPAVIVWLGGRRKDMVASLLDGAEYQEAWSALTARWPSYEAYRERARGHRTLPIFALAPAT
jgi:deazaflavin-dependent oxidoreductase (nitroreductase family)